MKFQMLIRLFLLAFPLAALLFFAQSTAQAKTLSENVRTLHVDKITENTL